MTAFLIDPAAQAVTPVEPQDSQDFLEWLREVIGCAQLTVMPVANDSFAVWCDAMGMLRPGRAFWRFADSDYRYAGKSVVTRVDPTGLPQPFPPQATAEEVAAGLRWHPPEDLKQIVEVLAVVENDEGRLVPTIHREVLWNTEIVPEPPVAPPEPEEGPPILSGWTVFETPDGSYLAVQMMLAGNGLVQGARVGAPSLDEIRKKLPPGLVRVLPGETDHPDIVESWRVPTH